MSKLTKIGYSEAAAMAMVFMGAKIFLGYPRMVVQQGSTAGWLIIFLGGYLSIAFWFVISALLARFPGKSLMTIAEEVLGPFVGLALNVVLFAYISLSTSILLRLFSEAVILTALPEAPISAVVFLFIIPAWIAAYLGLEGISRSTYISLPFIMAGTFAVLLSLYPFWDSRELFPVLGEGVWPLLKNGFLNSSAFGEVLILALLVPFFSFGAQRLRNIGIFSIMVVTVSFVLITVVYLMVMPFPEATENLAPFYQLSRVIYLGRFFQRLEAVFVLFWTFTAFLRLAIGLLASGIVLQEMLKLPYYRPLLPALIILYIALALSPDSIAQSIALETNIRLLYGWFFTFALPCGVWVIAVWRGKGEPHGIKKG